MGDLLRVSLLAFFLSIGYCINLITQLFPLSQHEFSISLLLYEISNGFLLVLCLILTITSFCFKPNKNESRNNEQVYIYIIYIYIYIYIYSVHLYIIYVLQFIN